MPLDAAPLADPRAATRAAMADAEAMFRALGEAQRRAGEATADRFDPARYNLIVELSLYAWCTRHRRDLVEHRRRRARSAVRAYRTLRRAGAA